jgi:HEAT repeat protein
MASILAIVALSPQTARSQTSGAPTIEVQIRNTPAGADDYLTWAPAKARIRQVSGAGSNDLAVVLTNDAQESIPPGRTQPADGDVCFDFTVLPMKTVGQDSLAVTLPKDGSWVDFVVAGKYPRSSSDHKDAVIEVHGGIAGGPLLHKHAVMVRIRKDHRSLTQKERDRYLEALDYMHRQLASPDGDGSMYEYFVRMHNLAAAGYMFGTDDRPPYIQYYWFDMAHKAPAFLTWHRVFLLQFEREIQKAYPDVAIPYWILTKKSELFTPEFLGANAVHLRPDGGATGEVAAEFSPSNPLYGWTVDFENPDRKEIQRATAVREPGAVPPDKDQFKKFTDDSVLFRYNEFSKYPTRNNAGGFVEAMEYSPHNLGHNWTGQWMRNCRTSPSDPIFWVFHCGFDRQWAHWQHLKDRFEPDGSKDSYFPLGKFIDPGGNPDPCNILHTPNKCVPIGHRLDDTMWPWNQETGRRATAKGSWPQQELADSFKKPFAASALPGLWPTDPAAPTPGDMIDYQGIHSGRLDMGFAYDDSPYGPADETPLKLASAQAPQAGAAADDAVTTFLDPNKSTQERITAVGNVDRAVMARGDRAGQVLAILHDQQQDERVRLEAFKLARDFDYPGWKKEASAIASERKSGGEALAIAALDALFVSMMFESSDQNEMGGMQMNDGMSALQKALTDPRPSVRTKALWTLAPTKDPRVTEVLVQSLRGGGDVPFAPAQAIKGLSFAQQAVAHADLIRPFLSDKDPVIRATAVSALLTDPNSRRLILGLLEDANQPHEVRSSAIHGLIAGGAGFLAGVLKVASDPATDPKLRAKAIAALGVTARSRDSKLSRMQMDEIQAALTSVSEADSRRIGPVVGKTLKDVRARIEKQREN